MRTRPINSRAAQYSPRRRMVATLLAAPLAAVLAIAFWTQPAATHEASDPPPSAKQTVSHRAARSGQAPRGELAYHWNPGELLTYKVRSHTSVRIDEEGWENDGPANSIEITGLCSYRVLRIEEGIATVAAQMSGTRVQGDEKHQVLLEELLDAEPVVLLLDERGQRLDCRLSPDLPTGDRQTLAGMHEHQLVLPEHPGTPSWTTTESGPAGTFTCTHSLTRNGTIEKRRGAPSAGGSVGCEVLHSEIVATLGTTWIEVLDAREAFAISNGEERLGAVESSFHMSPAAQTVEPEGLARIWADAEVAATFTSQSDPGAQGSSALELQSAQTLEDRYRAIPLDEVFNRLRAVTETAEAHAGTVDAIHALRDWLLVNPAEAFALVDALADPSLPVAFTARAIHALELASARPEAQLALADLLQRPGEFSRQSVLQAVIAAGGVGAVHPDLHVALSDTINRAGGTGDFSVGDAALYALGNLAPSNPVVAEQLLEALLPDLASSNHERTTHTALNALANGRLATPETVAQATTLAHSHPGPEVRAAAIHYLSRLPDTAPTSLTPYLHDPSENVQLETIEALARLLPGHPEIAVPLEQHLTTTSSDLLITRLQEILNK